MYLCGLMQTNTKRTPSPPGTKQSSTFRGAFLFYPPINLPMRDGLGRNFLRKACDPFFLSSSSVHRFAPVAPLSPLLTPPCRLQLPQLRRRLQSLRQLSTSPQPASKPLLEVRKTRMIEIQV